MKHDHRPLTPAQASEVVPAYFTPERDTRTLRNLSVLEQMYGYYNRD